ncbi:hypothetical protein [Herbihabitans rhizosphaerae]|uniref:hypothetical protein n=1 Tax=Herbihabitans rhizosphaerae TaxID=1872711 RepID=UPI00102B777B|nr:hypothetical protein [Herbihabitans rhizosphaerae]
MNRFALPIKAYTYGWGYGTALIPMPGTASVLLSLPSNGSRCPWCVVDLNTGATVRGTAMPGDLRAAVFASDAEDPRPWVLATYGLGRLELEPRPRITDVTRKGIGKYQAELFDVGHGLLGISHRMSKSLLLVSASDGSRVKRLAMPGAHLAVPLPNGHMRFLGLHHGGACDVDVSAAKVVRRYQVPHGTDARLAGDRIVALVGERREVRPVRAGETPVPGAPIVMLAGPDDGTDPDLGFWVDTDEIVVLDADTMEVRRRVPAPPSAVRVLGEDSTGRIVVGTNRGFALLSPDSLHVVTAYQRPYEITAAVSCPGTDMVAVLVDDPEDRALYTLRW